MKLNMIYSSRYIAST